MRPMAGDDEGARSASVERSTVCVSERRGRQSISEARNTTRSIGGAPATNSAVRLASPRVVGPLVALLAEDEANKVSQDSAVVAFQRSSVHCARGMRSVAVEDWGEKVCSWYTDVWTSNMKQPARSLRSDSISTQQPQRSSRVIVAAASGVGSVGNWESATCAEERTLSYGCQRGDRGVVVLLVVVVPVNSR